MRKTPRRLTGLPRERLAVLRRSTKSSGGRDLNPRLSTTEIHQPLYRQVKQFIENKIISGYWRPQMCIPSENELVKSLRISRMTIHRALRELTTEGLLSRVPGVGTFVAQAKPLSTLFNVRSIAEEITSMNGVHSSRIVLLKKERVRDSVAASMDLLPKSEIFHAVVVHRNRGVPIQLEDRYVNPAVAPEFIQQDFTKITPSEYLISIAPIDEAEHIVEAAMPDSRIRRYLEIPAPEPCLVLHRKTWSWGVVATLSRFFYPGSRYRLHGRFKPSILSKMADI